MSIISEIGTLIKQSVEKSENTTFCMSQYHILVNILKHYVNHPLSPELDAFSDALLREKTAFIQRQEAQLIGKNLTDTHFEAIARWALSEARDKAFLKIAAKFKFTPNSSIAQKLYSILNRLYGFTEQQCDTDNALNSLKLLLITSRLNHRHPTIYQKHQEQTDTLIEAYTNKSMSIDALKEQLTQLGYPSLDRTLTRFPVLRAIESVEQVNKKIVDEATAVFHDAFTLETDLVGGLTREKMQGDEVLYRGLNTTSGEITAQDIIAKFNYAHRSQSATDPGLARQAFVIDGEHYDYTGRASIATACTLNPAVAALYAFDNKPNLHLYGWVYEIRPKKDTQALNLMHYNSIRSNYREMDLHHANAEDIIAAHKVEIMNMDGHGLTYQVTQTIQNPYYKNRNDEDTAQSFFTKHSTVKISHAQRSYYKTLGEVLDKVEVINADGTSSLVPSFSDANALAVYERYKHKGTPKERLLVTQEELRNKRAQVKPFSEMIALWNKNSPTPLVKQTYEQWIELIRRNQLPFKIGIDNDVSITSDLMWIHFTQMNPYDSWKCFLCVHPDSLEQAANLLKDKYLTAPQYQSILHASKIAVKKPAGEGGRLAIILYASTEKNARLWTELLSNIEKDFIKAGIRPRPLTSCSEFPSNLIDNKIPGSLYTYYKCDKFAWDRKPGHFSDVTVQDTRHCFAQRAHNEPSSLAAFDAITALSHQEGARHIQTNKAIHDDFAKVNQTLLQNPSEINLAAQALLQQAQNSLAILRLDELTSWNQIVKKHQLLTTPQHINALMAVKKQLKKQIAHQHWYDIFSIFFRSYADKKAALIDLYNDIEKHEQDPVPQSTNLNQIISQWKNTSNHFKTIQQHRNRFFSPHRPSVKTSTEAFIESLENDYGSLDI